MKKFLDANFLLNSKTAEHLYHDFAEAMPLIDYHCHLSPAAIATDHRFENLTAAWLHGDHYKWRAMRTNGVAEHFITGTADDWQKFEKWAETVPYTLRNPLYHWTHLELQRYFNIAAILEPASADGIYKECSGRLQEPEFSAKNLLRKMNVRVVCTTDDPVDSLEYHQVLQQDGSDILVLPAFRPDKAMQVDDPAAFNQYLTRLEQVWGKSIHHYDHYLEALKSRHDFFATRGCTVADHGLEQLYAEPFTEPEVKHLFDRLRKGKQLEPKEKNQFRSAMLVRFATWNHEKSWVQQFHVGAMRNNNSRMAALLGPDTGWDSIGDFSQARALASFLDGMDKKNALAKTILYNLNPADNALMATMIGNFNDGSSAGKIQWGSAWWFLDQKDGMIQQLNTISNMSLLSRFVGMLTDSRSFLSYPRHEYFRRILCNLFGEEVESGQLPNDTAWIGKIVQDICFYNARNYFGWKVQE